VLGQATGTLDHETHHGPNSGEATTFPHIVFSATLCRDYIQTCSPRRDLSNDVSHSQLGGREDIDSQPLVVGSQIASLTLGPSFAHNLGDKFPNGQCDAIFNICASKPFQRYQEHPNARCFGPCCRALNIWESRRTPSPQLWKCWASPPHLAKVGLRQFRLESRDFGNS
jgi:hypothetical protein